MRRTNIMPYTSKDNAASYISKNNLKKEEKRSLLEITLKEAVNVVMIAQGVNTYELLNRNYYLEETVDLFDNTFIKLAYFEGRGKSRSQGTAALFSDTHDYVVIIDGLNTCENKNVREVHKNIDSFLGENGFDIISPKMKPDNYKRWKEYKSISDSEIPRSEVFYEQYDPNSAVPLNEVKNLIKTK